jgi:hypothetical protein
VGCFPAMDATDISRLSWSTDDCSSAVGPGTKVRVSQRNALRSFASVKPKIVANSASRAGVFTSADSAAPAKCKVENGDRTEGVCKGKYASNYSIPVKTNH